MGVAGHTTPVWYDEADQIPDGAAKKLWIYDGAWLSATFA